MSPHRKTLQLCAQVRRALETTLAGELDDELLFDVELDDVLPAPDDSRLEVRFLAHGAAAAAGREAVEAALEAARPAFVRSVVEAISRRRAPELRFVVGRAPESAGGDPTGSDAD